MPSLLLQKTAVKAEAKQNKETLARRLLLWQNGDIDNLLAESLTLQNRLKNYAGKYCCSVQQLHDAGKRQSCCSIAFINGQYRYTSPQSRNYARASFETSGRKTGLTGLTASQWTS